MAFLCVMMQAVSTISRFEDLKCSHCGTDFNKNELQTFATCCQQPLMADYSFTDKPDRSLLEKREHTMWRYREMLPLLHDENRVSLQEGMTPMLNWHNLAARYELENLLVKDEGVNPTGSFKARGLSMAVSRARELAVSSAVIPTAGNAGGALSAYCAQAGMKATVVMPRNTPKVFIDECDMRGAEIILCEGLIDECGKLASAIASKTGAFNFSTLKEPYRLEGKKTMGYEIAEHYSWTLPDVIIYPTGGGTGLIGMWKAFDEMARLGWIEGDKRPRMIAVQSEVCSPIFDIYKKNKAKGPYKMSIANGLSVPSAFGAMLIINIIRQSHGTVVTVSDQQILAGAAEIGAAQGFLISPEGAAVWECLKYMLRERLISRKDRIVILNTGNGLKYIENYREHFL